ncbi:MAG: pyruvate, phosphate dikinase [Bacteroidetes bacterium]|nr:MAG: pyruvate, phosphate dikinase [Bacteroidota bacterium]
MAVRMDSEGEMTEKPEWSIVVESMRRTDRQMYMVVARKLLNDLFVRRREGGRELFGRIGGEEGSGEVNMPTRRWLSENLYGHADMIFRVGKERLGDAEMMRMIEKWIKEEKSHWLEKALVQQNSAISEVTEGVRRYYYSVGRGGSEEMEEETSPVKKGIRVALIRRFLTEQLEFINTAKNYCRIRDFYDLLQRLIFPGESHGKVGGKSAGLFLAFKVVERSTEEKELLGSVKVPKTWYITSDGIMSFIYYNNLEEVIEEKYKDIDEIRDEYPHLIQAFKNSEFPPELKNGLSRALDDLWDNPIIVRSSSLLEDRMGSSFAGKYKSLFLANQGTKEERLEALMDAIAEVFASTFGPDPIGYRIERGLLDFNEEMGIMIQEVVGKRIGRYFFPAFAGAAFSNNEFRWSPRIKRDDGLIRMVAGLGTRAVDRVSSEYPILIVPGQPDLKVNLSFEEMVRYSPKNIDVLNLETNSFETVSISRLLNEIGNEFPMLNEIFSIQEERHLKSPVGLGIDTRKDEVVVTFDNMVRNTDYLNKVHGLLKVLRKKLGTPVDIEFACDGDNLYLLQCRPQSSTKDSVSAVIPRDIPEDRILFTANKYVSNGIVPDINYIVYVDPVNYGKHELHNLKAIGRYIGKINQLLPKKRFVLMGPGRWGSRDDIRLGVNVTYSDINNTAVLIEIAKQKGNYTPDLSFGTHFFQDLVETSIRYLPLYPDEKGIIFNERFLNSSENILSRILPESSYLADTIKIINIPEVTNGLVLRLLMNADEEEAVAILTQPSAIPIYNTSTLLQKENLFNEPLHWRLHIADLIASKLDEKLFGVKAVYLFGTVFNLAAGANSDIDLLVHFTGNNEQRERVWAWFEGWNHSLSEINYIQSGYKLPNILDIHIATDKDIEEKEYYRDLINPKKRMSKKLRMNSD